MSTAPAARIRAVLFDAAGTLIAPREKVGATYARMAARQGVELPAWRLDDAFRRVLRRAPPLAHPETGAGEVERRERLWWRDRVRETFRAADSTVRFPDFEALFDALFAHYAAGEAWTLRPGARGALRALRARGCAIGVVSNFDRRLRKILEDLGIAEEIDVVVLPSDCGATKPSPRIFEAALRRLGVAPSEALYVGDDPEADVAAARAAGLRAVDVTALPSLEALPAKVEALATLGT